jgi:hypothetical protein
MKHIGWVIATGEHDHLVQANRDFAAMLMGKGLQRARGDLGRRLRTRLAALERAPEAVCSLRRSLQRRLHHGLGHSRLLPGDEIVRGKPRA